MEEKKITPVVNAGNVTVKKKTFGQKFKEAFISQDFGTAVAGVNKNVIIPAIKRVIADAVANTVNSILFGSQPMQNNRILNASTWSWNGITYGGQSVNYSAIGKQQQQNVTAQVPSLGRYKYDEIIIQPDISKGETMVDAERHADEVLFTLRDQLERFGKVSINDLFETCSLPMVSTMGNYGWTNLKDADKVLIPEAGFLLKMPNPVLLR